MCSSTPSRPQADLWALGCTLYTLLLAAHPYGGSTPQEARCQA